MVAILSNDKDFIVRAVQEMYTDVAENPSKVFHFPTGRVACEFVGYPTDELDAIPLTAVESFAGVGYPHKADVIRPGHTVLDIGSGSGTDALIAGLRVGDTGTVYGLDMTQAMLKKLEANRDLMGASHVQLLEGNAEEIPLGDASVDVITSNGVLNLVPDKPAAFAEMHRVLKDDGWVQIADIVVGTPIGEESKSDPALWAECIVGASLEDQYIELFTAAGFKDIETLHRFEYFEGSSSEATRKVAKGFNARSIEIRMHK